MSSLKTAVRGAAVTAALLLAACQPEGAPPTTVIAAPSALDQGVMALRAGDYGRAAAWCRQAANEPLAAPQAFACLGDAEAGLGERGGAEAAWLAYLDRVPGDAARRHALARFYMEDGRYPQAQVQLDRVSQMGQATAETFFLQGECFRLQGQCQPALGGYHQSLRIDPTFVAARDGMERARRDICPRPTVPAARPRVQERFTGGGAALRPGQW